MDQNKISRREALGAVAAVAATGIAGLSRAEEPTINTAQSQPEKIKQSVCQWCYGGMSIKDLCSKAKKMGYQSVELLSENDWKTVSDAGLVCAVANGPTSIGYGWNNPKDHDKFVAGSERLIPLVAAAGIPQMIGMMIESNLSEGKQSLGSDLSALTYGVSVTDGCVGWNETVAMLEEAYDAV